MHIVFIAAAETTEAAPISIFARTGRNMWFKRRINRDRNKYVQRREKEPAFCWESEMEHEAYETAMPQAHTIIFSIPMAKKCYCSSNIFCWKKIFSEIVTNLGEDALHPDQECSVDGKE